MLAGQRDNGAEFRVRNVVAGVEDLFRAKFTGQEHFAEADAFDPKAGVENGADHGRVRVGFHRVQQRLPGEWDGLHQRAAALRHRGFVVDVQRRAEPFGRPDERIAEPRLHGFLFLPPRSFGISGQDRTKQCDVERA